MDVHKISHDFCLHTYYCKCKRVKSAHMTSHCRNREHFARIVDNRGHIPEMKDLEDIWEAGIKL